MSIQAHVHETGPVRAHVHAYDAPDAHVATPVIERLIPGPPGPGLPPGGIPGQLIKKASVEDYDTEWTNLSSEDVGLTVITAVEIAAILQS